ERQVRPTIRIPQFAMPAIVACLIMGLACSDATAPRAPVGDSASPIGSGTSTAPTFNPATQTMILRDQFSYSTFAQAVTGGWQCSDASTTEDVSTNPRGACQIVDGVSGAAGDHAIRLVYDGIANAAGQEAHAWGRPFSDTLAALPGHAVYLSYDFRITPGGGFRLDDGQHIVKVKWLELWTNTDRAQFNTGYQNCWNNVPQNSARGGGTIFQFYGNAGAVSNCHAGQVSPPFIYQGAGGYHRLTHKYVTQSHAGARDGVAQTWLDGVLIQDVRASDCGTVVPAAVGDAAGKAKWCEHGDLDAMFVRQSIRRLTFGSVSTSVLWPF